MRRRLISQATRLWVIATLFEVSLPACVHGANPGVAPSRHSSEEPSEEGQFAGQILWTETWDGQPRALFVPEQALRETPLESLPIGEGDREALRNQLGGYEEFRKKLLEHKGIELPECSAAPEGQVVPHQPTTLERKIVDYSTFAFTANVVDVVTGWRRGQVAQAVYVRVDSILHDPERRLVLGEVLGFFQYAGEMRIGDRRLCTQPAPDSLLAGRGDTLLLAGDPHFYDQHLIHASLRLPVREGVVQPVRLPTLLPAAPVSLRELESRIAARREEVH